MVTPRCPSLVLSLLLVLSTISVPGYSQQISARITRADPERVFLRGGSVTFSGSFPDSSFSLFINNVSTTIVNRNQTHVGCLAPTLNQTGYASVSLYATSSTSSSGDPLVSYSALDRVLYYSDDCPGPGTYGPVQSECRPCPDGGICPGGARLWPSSGYWTPDESALYLSKCVPEVRCSGGRDVDSSCSPGYEGVNCGSCSELHRRQADTCEACTASNFVTALLTIVVFIALLALCTCLLDDRLLTTILSAVMCLQVVAAVGKMASYSMPFVIRSFYNYLSVLNLDYESSQPGCWLITNNSIAATYYGNIVLMIITLVLTAGMTLILSKTVKAKSSFYRRRTGSAVLIVWSIFYYILVARSFEVMFCRRDRDGSGDLFMVMEPSIRCFQGSHIPLFIIALLVVLGLGVGSPIALSYYLHTQHANLWVDKNLYSRYGPIYESFKKPYYLFGMATFIIDFVLGVCSALLRYENVPQGVVSVLFLLAYTVVCAFKRPFREKLENIATTAAFVVATVSTLVNTILTLAAEKSLGGVNSLADALGTEGEASDDSESDGGEGNPVRFGLSVFLITLTVAVVLCFAALIVYRIYRVISRNRGRDVYGSAPRQKSSFKSTMGTSRADDGSNGVSRDSDDDEASGEDGSRLEFGWYDVSASDRKHTSGTGGGHPIIDEDGVPDSLGGDTGLEMRSVAPARWDGDDSRDGDGLDDIEL